VFFPKPFPTVNPGYPELIGSDAFAPTPPHEYQKIGDLLGKLLRVGVGTTRLHGLQAARTYNVIDPEYSGTTLKTNDRSNA